MLPAPSIVAQFVALAQPWAEMVPSLIVAQPPRMPLSFGDVVVMLPRPPRMAGGIKDAAAPVLWLMVPKARLALLTLLLFTWIIAAPLSTSVELNACKFVVPVLGLSNRMLLLAVPCPAFSPPNVKAETGLMILLVGELG